MTDLQRRALARLPLTEAEVERMYLQPQGSLYAVIATLCESHERLRTENAGQAILLAEAEADNARLQAERDQLSERLAAYTE